MPNDCVSSGYQLDTTRAPLFQNHRRLFLFGNDAKLRHHAKAVHEDTTVYYRSTNDRQAGYVKRDDFGI